MKYLFKKTRILSLIILVLAFLGCEEDDEGSRLPAVTAGFTFDLIQNTGTVSFINISENAQEFAWDFGNGTTSTEINPTVTFPSGTYTVSLTASNVAGASDTVEDVITITIPEPPTPLALPIDFDGTNVDYGSIVGDNIGFSVVTNPETGNGNTTNVGQMIAGGGQFQNAQFPLGTAVDFSGENKTIQLELFSSTAIAVLVKFENGTGGARDVEVLTSHTGSGWETLSFDFGTNGVASFIDGDAQNGQALIPDGQYGQMVLFVGFNTDPGVEGTFLVDNIAQTASDGGGMVTEPTMAAPAPMQDAANVTSVFSNAYTNGAGTNPRAFGNDGGATFSEIQVAGDDVWSYADTNFVGLQNDAGFDGRTNFSMDIWVAEDISFRAGLISFTDPVSREDVEVNLTGGQWNNIDVALTDLVPSLGSEGPLPDSPTINQIIFDVLGDGVEASIFVDNVFFYTAGGGGMVTEPTMAAPAPTQDAANVTSVFSNAYTNGAGTNPRAFGNDGGATFSEIQVAGDDVWSYADTNFVGLQNDAGFDGRTNFSMDIWVAEDISFRAGLISFTDPVSREDVEVNLTGGQWNNIDVALADLVPSLGSEGPLPDSPTINQIIFDVLGDGVEASIFVDNVFFYTVDTGGGSGAIFEEDFSTDTSGDWTPLVSAAGVPATEASITYLPTGGVANGGLQFFGQNPNTDGKNYLFRLQKDGLSITGGSNLQLRFSMRREGAITASAINTQVQILSASGPPTVVNLNNLEALSGMELSDTQFTEYTVDLPGIVADPNGTVFFDVSIGAGAVMDAGATVIIDDISLEQTN